MTALSCNVCHRLFICHPADGEIPLRCDDCLLIAPGGQQAWTRLVSACCAS